MSAFTGTGTLLGLAIRRDRIQLPAWLLGLTGVYAASASSVVGLYDTEPTRMTYASTTAASAVTRAFNGPTAGPSLGAIAMVETYASISVLAALMSVFAVVRHTRQNEETGRAELIGSGVVGRYAAVTAAVSIGVLANVVLAALVASVLMGLGLPTTGSVLAGASIGAAGLAFTGVAAVTAQIAQSSRAANGLASALVGLAFLLRAVGDGLGRVGADGLSVVSAWPSWLSPLAWGQQSLPFEGDRWWVLAVPVVFVAALVAAAFGLASRRDLGTGLLPTRPGPATAPRSLLGPLGLAWRLQRTVLLGWAAGLVIGGAVLGAVADEVDRMTEGNEQLAELIRQMGGSAALIDAFLAGVLGIMAITASGFTVQSLLRMRAEEAAGHLEPVLATAVGRGRWMASHLTVAVLGTALLLALTGASAGLTYGLIAGDPGQVAGLAGAALVRLPAALALGGFVVAVFGLLPRWSVALAWSALAVCLLIGQVGALLDLPQVVLDVSPFTHVPSVPVDDPEALPLAVLTAVAVVLAAAGLFGFRRRDVS